MPGTIVIKVATVATFMLSQRGMRVYDQDSTVCLLLALPATRAAELESRWRAGGYFARWRMKP